MTFYSRCNTNIMLLTISGITFADVLNVTAEIYKRKKKAQDIEFFGKVINKIACVDISSHTLFFFTRGNIFKKNIALISRNKK